MEALRQGIVERGGPMARGRMRQEESALAGREDRVAKRLGEVLSHDELDPRKCLREVHAFQHGPNQSDRWLDHQQLAVEIGQEAQGVYTHTEEDQAPRRRLVCALREVLRELSGFLFRILRTRFLHAAYPDR